MRKRAASISCWPFIAFLFAFLWNWRAGLLMVLAYIAMVALVIAMNDPRRP